MLTKNNIFNNELLPALRRSCHSAICAAEEELPLLNPEDSRPNAPRVRAKDVEISNQLNKDLLSTCCAFVVYSEAETSPNTTAGSGDEDIAKKNEGVLLRGGATNALNSVAQITVYSRHPHLVYQLGDLIVEHINEKAQRRNDFRYFSFLERHGAFNEDVDAWVGIYKMKVQLQPNYGWGD